MTKRPPIARNLIGLAALLCVLIAGAACTRSGLVQRDMSNSKATLTVVGDARTVALGRANDSRLWEVPGNVVTVGVGTGATQPRVDEQGTAMTIAGTGLVESLGGNGVARTTGSLHTSYLIGLPPGQLPAATYTLQGGSNGRDLDEVFQQLSRNHGPFFFVVGVGEFPVLSARALQQAPIGEMPIHGQNASRYFRDQSRGGNLRAVFAAAVHSQPNRLSGSDLRVFYEPPEARQGERRVIQAGYGLVSSIEDLDPARLASGGLDEAPGRILSIGELLPTSRVRNARIAVYEIQSLDRR